MDNELEEALKVPKSPKPVQTVTPPKHIQPAPISRGVMMNKPRGKPRGRG